MMVDYSIMMMFADLQSSLAILKTIVNSMGMQVFDLNYFALTIAHFVEKRLNFIKHLAIIAK
jgi:hypothetical protein